MASPDRSEPLRLHQPSPAELAGQPGGRPLRPGPTHRHPDRIPFTALAAAEWVAALALINGLLAAALLWRPALGTRPGDPAPAVASAPWVFGAIQLLLRHLPLDPVWVGLGLPAAALGLVAALPWLGWRLGERWARRLFWGLYWMVAALTLASLALR